MGTAADTLVSKHPTIVSQLSGPVLTYLSRYKPYDGSAQDLYMAVFFPAARKVPPSTTFESIYKKLYPESWTGIYKKFVKGNPGVKTVQDYIDKVNRHRSSAKLSAAEQKALSSVAQSLGVPSDSLHKLIAFESGWNPKATNPYSGARGLIQFMPKTAEAMGYKGSVNVVLLATVAAVLYFLGRRYGVL